jgi:hypothetical protein
MASHTPGPAKLVQLSWSSGKQSGCHSIAKTGHKLCRISDAVADFSCHFWGIFVFPKKKSMILFHDRIGIPIIMENPYFCGIIIGIPIFLK